MRVLACVVALLGSSDAARLALQELQAARSDIDLAVDAVSGTNEDTATVASAHAAELVAAGENADTIIPRWHGATAALFEVQAASNAALQWQGEVDDQITAIRATLGDTDNGLAAALDGTATYEEVRAISSGAPLLSVADSLSDTTDEATRLSAVLKQLAETMVSATGLTERIDEISGVWARVDLDLVRGLEQRAGSLHFTFESASGALTGGKDVLHQQFDDWDALGSWTQARRVYTYFDEMRGGFEQIGHTRTVIDPAFDDLQQLVRDTAQAAAALVDATREVAHFRDRGVGAAETIQRIFCSDRSQRTFDLDADVDLRSMTCEQSLYSVVGMQHCRCSSESDCYVTSQYRPAPASSKRCFRPV